MTFLKRWVINEDQESCETGAERNCAHKSSPLEWGNEVAPGVDTVADQLPNQLNRIRGVP
jgi:hypothetical protein